VSLPSQNIEEKLRRLMVMAILEWIYFIGSFRGVIKDTHCKKLTGQMDTGIFERLRDDCPL
jgi:hypothetical protein